MDEQLLTALAEACAPFADGRFHVCELTIVPGDGRLCPVSYTHLTLPTNREV